MLSDNIKKYRKENNLSQDELAEKLGVSRQSISLWENGQTQPTIDNIIALARIFNVSTDAILENSGGANAPQEAAAMKSKTKALSIVGIVLAAAVVLCGAFAVMHFSNKNSTATASTVQEGSASLPANVTLPETDQQTVDLFACCKDFVIQNGSLNGDYCIYQQPATQYGGYEDEYFSVSYWGDSDMVEFCLHCPLSETQSINFFLRMRGEYNHQYEYAASKYLRESGDSFRFATGTIDPAVFSDQYPLTCDQYEGSTDGQDEFMEEARVGMCDLIHCLKSFVEAEAIDCTFADFEFKNF